MNDCKNENSNCGDMLENTGLVLKQGAQQQKDAFSIGCQVKNALDIPRDISVTLDNKEGTTDKEFSIFDALSLVSWIKKLKADGYAVGNFGEIPASVVSQYILANAIVFNQIRMEVSASSTQFNNKLALLNAEINGDLQEKKITLSTSVNAEQYNPKIQFYAGDIKVDEKTAFVLTVKAGETVNLTFYFKAILNRY